MVHNRPMSPASKSPSRRPGTPERRGYHHGALKDALVTVAERLLAERGPAGFTLTDAAREAGVSAAAPYRHFLDREALVAEVARRGFGEFAERLSMAARGEGDPMAALIAMGRAYLAFASDRPGAYQAMFAAQRTGSDPDLSSASETAFDLLLDGMRRAIARNLPDAGDALAQQIWALSHGIATLTAAGRLGGDCAGTSETLLIDGVTALIRGLGVGRNGADGPAPASPGNPPGPSPQSLPDPQH
jgi:AcrR family transcriptional regulator